MTEKKLTRKEKSIINKQKFAESKAKAEAEKDAKDNQALEYRKEEIDALVAKYGKKRKIYSPELGDLICELIESGLSVAKIGEMQGMPCKQTIYQWTFENEDFSIKYARARIAQADNDFEELEEIAGARPKTIYDAQGNAILDKTELAWRQQRIDVRKWRLAKIRPDKYSEKISQEITGKDGLPLSNSIRIEFIKPTKNESSKTEVL